jgi:hypothetical protein
MMSGCSSRQVFFADAGLLQYLEQGSFRQILFMKRNNHSSFFAWMIMDVIAALRRILFLKRVLMTCLEVNAGNLGMGFNT